MSDDRVTQQGEILFLSGGGIANVRQSITVVCDRCEKTVNGWVHTGTFNYCFECMDTRFGKCTHPEEEMRTSAFTGTRYCGLCSAIFSPISPLTKEQELAAANADLVSRLQAAEQARDAAIKSVGETSRQLGAAEARIQSLTEAQRWIPVSEKLPEMTETYAGSPKRWKGLVFTGNYITEGKYEESYSRRIPGWKNSYDRCISVTHWREFPEPPVAHNEGAESK